MYLFNMIEVKDWYQTQNELMKMQHSQNTSGT